MKIQVKDTLMNEITNNGWKISIDYGIIASPEGRSLIVEPRLSRLLYMLALNANRMASRFYLIENVWKDTVVNEESLTRAIADLRKILGKNFGKAVKITTIPKRGYMISFAENIKVRTFKVRNTRPLWYAMVGCLVFIITLMWYTGFLKIVVI